MYERDLDTALLLSRLQSGGESEEPLSSNLGVFMHVFRLRNLLLGHVHSLI